LEPGLIGFQTPSGRNCDSDSGASYHCAGSPVQGNPRDTTCEGIHHLESCRLVGKQQSTVSDVQHEDYKSPTPSAV